LEALDKAIDYTNKVNDKLGDTLLFPKLVLYYNLASCHSLKAQYMVESDLDPETNDIDGLYRAGQEPKEIEKVWPLIGAKWRTNRKETKIIDSEAEKAFNELKNIVPLLSHEKHLNDLDWEESSDPSSERIWLVDSTMEDEDFIFLRSDIHKWEPEFKNWYDSALQGRKPNADAVRTLLSNL